MKLRLTPVTITTALLLSAAGLLSQQNAAIATPEGLTPEQANRLSRDLVPPNSQSFFQQGRTRIEQEIQLLDRRQRSSNEPLLRTTRNSQEELDRLPQLQRDDFNQHQSRDW